MPQSSVCCCLDSTLSSVVAVIPPNVAVTILGPVVDRFITTEGRAVLSLLPNIVDLN